MIWNLERNIAVCVGEGNTVPVEALTSRLTIEYVETLPRVTHVLT
jgi:hypothetical protein